MLDIATIRAHFPALATGATFFDNPGGTQVAQEVITRMQQYFMYSNANHGGVFRTSRDSDAVLDQARQAVADFLHAARAEEIIFGQNMTSLTLHISRSLAHILEPGDELVVTTLDHDANIAPWLLIAEERGCIVRRVTFLAEDCTLNMQEMEQVITSKTKLVAVGYASNAFGSITDVKKVAEMAHRVGALCFVDAVQYAPHQYIDVQELDCDFLACSAYKFFGPHTGILYGKYDILESLKAYKVRPASNQLPYKFETGTQSHESIAGILGVMEYVAWVGETYGGEYREQLAIALHGQALALRQGMLALEAYETELSRILLQGLQSIAGLRIVGITDIEKIKQRVPTFSFTLNGWQPRAVAERLAQEEIYVWSGNFYALEALDQLGLNDNGGIVRVGLAHYNTREEIHQLVEVLKTMVQ